MIELARLLKLAGLLAESNMHRVYAATGEPFIVFHNPSRPELEAAFDGFPDHVPAFVPREVKGWLTSDGQHLYVWPSWYAHHGDVAYFFQLGTSGIRLEMTRKGPALSYNDGVNAAQDAATVLGSPAIQKLYGQGVRMARVEHFSKPVMTGIDAELPTEPRDIRWMNKKRRQMGLPPLCVR